MPAHNRAEWEAKFQRNRERDGAVDNALSDLGLNVVTVWECEAKDSHALKLRLQQLLDS